MKVRLEWYEVTQAGIVGMRRQIEARRRGLQDQFGFSGDDGWTIHIEGAAGEMAVAKSLNTYWSGSVNTFTAPDIGARIQVRTRSRSDYELIVRPGDADLDVYVLARGRIPEFDVVGFIVGSAAKQQEWLRSYGGRQPAYFVPDEALNPIESIRALGVQHG